MTVAQWLKTHTLRLREAGISTARLDCLILLEDALGRDRSWILARPEYTLDDSVLGILNTNSTRRLNHLPLAYIRGKSMFFGRNFIVNTHVLVPRSETEIIIELLKKMHLPPQPSIADIGTGSGCLGITAALEIPGSVLTLCDIDMQVLQVAKANAERFQVPASCIVSDLLDRVPPQHVLLVNLPYVPTHHPINRAASHEPSRALFAGENGMELYQKLWQQIVQSAKKPMIVLAESFPSQHSAMQKMAAKAGYQLTEAHDFIQSFVLCETGQI